MEGKGADKILVIETQPIDYIKSPQQYMWLVRLMLKKYPAMIKCMEERYLMYNEQKRYIREREKEGRAFVIRPDKPLNISAIEKDPAELERVYRLGRAAAEKRLEDLKKYLSD
jgi:predicted patatin/cPLA2 family phospholipase